MLKSKYSIYKRGSWEVFSDVCPYEVFFKHWLSPFWFHVSYCHSVEEAEEEIQDKIKPKKVMDGYVIKKVEVN